MAQPKRRWSKARTHKRRSTWKLEAPKFAKCPNCGEKLDGDSNFCDNCGNQVSDNINDKPNSVINCSDDAYFYIPETTFQEIMPIIIQSTFDKVFQDINETTSQTKIQSTSEATVQANNKLFNQLLKKLFNQQFQKIHSPVI